MSNETKQESIYCTEERPCIPCFTDNGPCADASQPVAIALDDWDFGWMAGNYGCSGDIRSLIGEQ